MPNKPWKAAERRGARAFGTQRNALSGGNAKVTRSDSLHPTLYLEQKWGARHAIWTLYDDTKAKARQEQKTPVILTHRKGSPGFLVTVHVQDLEQLCQAWLQANGGIVNLLSGAMDTSLSLTTAATCAGSLELLRGRGPEVTKRKKRKLAPLS